VRLSRRIEDAGERSRLADAIGALPNDAGGWIVRGIAAGASMDRIAAEARRHLDLWSNVQTRRLAAWPPTCLRRGPDAVLAAVIEESGRTFDRVLADSPERLADIRDAMPDIAERWELHTGVRGVFDQYEIEEQIQALLRPHVALPSGGMIEIAETAAVVAIDVDIGGAQRGGPEDTALLVNLEAAEAVARHVRLRDLAGHMVIDFVPLRRRGNRSRVVSALRRAMEQDRRPFQLAGYTPFGLVELTRQRRERSLGRRLTTACSTCEGAGRIRSAATIALEALRRVLIEARMGAGPTLKITASPSVVAALRGKAAPGLAEVERRLGTAIILDENANLAPDGFDVTSVRRGEV
jgi:ribonuclease G